MARIPEKVCAYNTWVCQDAANAEGTADATKDVGQVGSVSRV